MGRRSGARLHGDSVLGRSDHAVLGPGAVSAGAVPVLLATPGVEGLDVAYNVDPPGVVPARETAVLVTPATKSLGRRLIRAASFDALIEDS